MKNLPLCIYNKDYSHSFQYPSGYFWLFLTIFSFISKEEQQLIVSLPVYKKVIAN